MEDVPPSYESAIDREAWNIIAPWIPSSDLCSVALVCTKWHRIFIPLLWGNPASHFGTADDAVYVALTRFKRTLKRARLVVRQLTHTLHLPPAMSEIYDGPSPTWLRDVLEYLPNLQSLLVSQLPFFDHPSLVALKNGPKARTPSTSNDDEIVYYGLKLLLAAREPNTTSTGITEALTHFPRLVYLDLSYTTPARDISVLSVFSYLYELRILKLRGLGLRDAEAEMLAHAVGLRLRLLDVRENMLTDSSVRSLLQFCFLPLGADTNGCRTHNRRLEDWPVGMGPGPDVLSLDSLRREELDRDLLKQLTHPLTGRLAIEDSPHRGLTHLYIADNKLTDGGLASLLSSTRLHVVDAGTLDITKSLARKNPLCVPANGQEGVVASGVENLVSVLATCARNNLTYLRVNHAVITARLQHIEASPSARSVADLPSKEHAIAQAPVSAQYPVELSSMREPFFELSAEPAEAKHEPPGDCVQLALRPPVVDAPIPSLTTSKIGPKPLRGDGAFAPEAGANGGQGFVLDSSQDEEIVSNAFGCGQTPRERAKDKPHMAATLTNEQRPILQSLSCPGAERFLQSSSPSASSYARMEALLRKRPPITTLAPMTSHSAVSSTPASPFPVTRLHPSFLPNLRTLVLTSVPTIVPASSSTVDRLRDFISACADEAALALLSAQTNYSLPPGRARDVAEAQHAFSLFALRQIVLEMVPPQAEGKRGKPNLQSQPKGWHHLRQAISMSKSSTGDRDSENLWSAAEADFSFFGEEGEQENECGIYLHDPDKYSPTAGLNEKVVCESNDDVEEDFERSLPFSTLHTNNPTGSGTSIGTGTFGSLTTLRSLHNLPRGWTRRSSSSAENRHLDSRPLSSEAPGVSPAPTSNLSRAPQAQLEVPMLDVVAELAKFRQERKATYEQALRRWRGAGNSRVSGEPERDVPFVEGHWKGEVKIVRNSAPKGETGVVDIYGNYSEKRYLHP